MAFGFDSVGWGSRRSTQSVWGSLGLKRASDHAPTCCSGQAGAGSLGERWGVDTVAIGGLYLSDIVVERLSSGESKLLSQSVSVAVDAVGTHVEHFGYLLGAHTDTDIGTQSQIVFRQVWAELFQMDEEFGVHTVKMQFESRPLIVIIETVSDDGIDLPDILSGNVSFF